jgi:hypothetical protein
VADKNPKALSRLNQMLYPGVESDEDRQGMTEELLPSAAFAKNITHAQPGPTGYQTQLSPGREQDFLKWLLTQPFKFDTKSYFPDYDIRGMYDSGSIDEQRFATPYGLGFGPRSRYYKP